MAHWSREPDVFTRTVEILTREMTRFDWGTPSAVTSSERGLCLCEAILGQKPQVGWAGSSGCDEIPCSLQGIWHRDGTTAETSTNRVSLCIKTYLIKIKKTYRRHRDYHSSSRTSGSGIRMHAPSQIQNILVPSWLAEAARRLGGRWGLHAAVLYLYQGECGLGPKRWHRTAHVFSPANLTSAVAILSLVVALTHRSRPRLESQPIHPHHASFVRSKSPNSYRNSLSSLQAPSRTANKRLEQIQFRRPSPSPVSSLPARGMGPCRFLTCKARYSLGEVNNN
jgi:hypothetical protein